jgi:ribosome maturation factor RimP
LKQTRQALRSVKQVKTSVDPLEIAAHEHRIRTWARAAAEAEGCVLVDAEVRGGAARDRIELTVDRPGGVTVEDCARVSRRLKAVLAEANPLEHPFILEVSSPGLTRPLHTAADYRLFRGRLALLQLRTAIDGRTQLRGLLEGTAALADGSETVRIADETLARPVEVPLSQVAWGRLDFEPAARSTAAKVGRSGKGARA